MISIKIPHEKSYTAYKLISPDITHLFCMIPASLEYFRIRDSHFVHIATVAMISNAEKLQCLPVHMRIESHVQNAKEERPSMCCSALMNIS